VRFRLALKSPRKILAGRPVTLTTLVAASALMAVLTTTAAAWLTYEVTAGLPTREDISGIGDMAQSTTIYDHADKPVFTIFKEQRIEVPLDRMSPNLIRAVISVEDQRFHEHSGVDAVRVAAAALRNFETGRRAEGGSTITQQLARQSFLSRDKTFRRKLKEVILAGYIESEYTKEQILAMYLNKVYFGDGLYGVEAAARGYLGKSASDLTVDEAALLAGLIQSPSSYAPTVNLERALARRAVVLQAMVNSGAIDAATAEAAREAKVELVNGLENSEDTGLYFKEQVRRDLVDRFGGQRVYEGGLRVFTTLDPDLQRAAESAVEKGLEDIERRRGFAHTPRGRQQATPEGQSPDYLQAALVSIHPATGHVKAMVGGRDFSESRFNRAVQAKRQAGSAFKPLVFAAALEGGLTPASMISGLNDPVVTAEGQWIPEDEHASTAPSMTMRTALRTSSNRAAVQLLNTVGIPRAVDYAQRLNVGTPPSVPSLVLGAGEVTLTSLTAAYGAFVDGGIVRRPVLIRRVEDRDGEVLFEDAGDSHRAVSEATAFLMASMLADVVNAGTGYRARQTGFTLPAGGKTGTTNDYVDSWFIGFTPQIVTGVWVGFDQPKTIIRGGYAGEIAVPLWVNTMKEATKGHKPEWIARPSSVIGLNVCRVSGQLPSDSCESVDVTNREGDIESRSMIYTEYFVRGTQPTTVCPLHPRRTIIDALAGAIGHESRPAPIPAEIAGVPVAPPARPTSGTAAPAAAPPASTAESQEPARRRGFWSRLLGRDGDDARKAEEAAKKKEEAAKKEEQRKKPDRR
jgi:1A family penicillin-binding protein